MCCPTAAMPSASSSARRSRSPGGGDGPGLGATMRSMERFGYRRTTAPYLRSTMQRPKPRSRLARFITSASSMSYPLYDITATVAFCPAPCGRAAPRGGRERLPRSSCSADPL